MNWIVEHIDRVWNLYDEVVSLRDAIGSLDDVYESDMIDSKKDMGAYQCLDRALANLENYVYDLENDPNVSLTPPRRDI